MGSRVSARLILISLLTLAFTFDRTLIAIMPTYSADARMKFLREGLSEVGSQVLWVGSCIRTFGTQLTRSEFLRADASRAWQAECDARWWNSLPGYMTSRRSSLQRIGCKIPSIV